jgi:hypothetical protein
MLQSLKQILFLIAIFLPIGLLSEIGYAETKGCRKCEFKECISNMIKQKQSIVDGYERLANKWGKLWVSDGVPIDEIDLEKLGEKEDRRDTLEYLQKGHRIFKEDEEEMTAKIGKPKECGFSPDENIDMETDTVKCEMNLIKAEQVKRTMPCKELYVIALEHEGLHMAECQKRKGNKDLPTVIQTPAGKAREEMRAYNEEIKKLQNLLTEAKKDCPYRCKRTGKVFKTLPECNAKCPGRRPLGKLNICEQID